MKLLSMLMCLSLMACGTTQPVLESADVAGADVPKLLPTLHYIPEQKLDKKGKPITYKPTSNPYLKKGRAIKKSYIEAYIVARRAYMAGQMDRAKQVLTELVDSGARLSGPWVMLGDIAMDEPDVASEYFLKAIALNKNNVNAYLRLAKVQRMQGDFIAAQNTYAAVMSIWRDFPEAHLNLGVLYDVYLNDAIKAQQHLQAYQFLADKPNAQAIKWLDEVRQRSDSVVEAEAGDQAVVKLPQD
ncbi:MAG: tetratricopeptide repeat protein [Cellvibrionaceae bacterium]|nr:tetratricopeptide repeat protein [Cellvibrionaceae bacterium]